LNVLPRTRVIDAEHPALFGVAGEHCQHQPGALDRLDGAKLPGKRLDQGDGDFAGMPQQHLLRFLRDDGLRAIVELARKQPLHFA
jgi:hypothetical protein